MVFLEKSQAGMKFESFLIFFMNTCIMECPIVHNRNVKLFTVFMLHHCWYQNEIQFKWFPINCRDISYEFLGNKRNIFVIINNRNREASHSIKIIVCIIEKIFTTTINYCLISTQSNKMVAEVVSCWVCGWLQILKEKKLKWKLGEESNESQKQKS